MVAEKNFLIDSPTGKPMAADIFYLHGSEPKPVIIYYHGFNGFKDWGNFDIIAKHFASQGFVFVKFNGSHNGTTPEKPEEFADLEAYGNNNYTIELDDLGAVIDWVISPENKHAKQIDKNKVYLLGHSRGGGIVLLKAAEDIRVKAVTTWASVSECKTPWGNWPEEKMQEWKETGVQYYTNSRTHQQMPLYYQLYQNYIANQERLNIEKAIKSLTIPVLICHGTKDPAVPVEEAYQLHEWRHDAELFLVSSDHVFGRKHPWYEPVLPIPTEAVVEKTAEFFKTSNK